MTLVNWQWVSPTEAANAVKTVNDTANANYEEQQKRTLNDIFSRNVNAKGNLGPRFYQEASAAGLSPDRIQAAQKYFQQQQETNQATALGNIYELSLGYNPLAGQSPAPATPAPVAPTQPATPAQSEGTPSSSWFGDMADKVKHWFGGQPDETRANYAYLTPNERYESAQPIVDNNGLIQSQSSMANDTSGFTTPDMLNPGTSNGANGNAADIDTRNGSVNLGSTTLGASAMDPNALASIAPATDNETAPSNAAVAATLPPVPPQPVTPWYEDFQRSFDPSKSPLAQGAGASTATVPAADPQLMTWRVDNDGSNLYRQYDSALTQYLNGMGFKPREGENTSEAATRYLQSVYTNTLLANAPAGVNPYALLKDPKNPGAGLSEMGEQMVKNTQQGKIAEGKARDAVLQAKAGLQGIADKFGVQNAQEKELEVGDGSMLYDKSKRENVVLLKTVKTDIPLLQKQIDGANDIVSLQLLLPQVAKASGQSMGGVQPTEFNIQEVYKSAFPDLDEATVARIAAATFQGLRTGDFDKANAAIDSLGKSFDANTLKQRMTSMLSMANHNADVGLNTYTYGGRKEEAVKNANGSGALAPTAAPASTPVAKGSWFSDPNNKVFQGVSGDPYYVTQRDQSGNAVQAQNFRGDRFNVVDRGNGVVLNPVQPAPAAPAAASWTPRRPAASSPKIGQVRTFPNGRKASWDGRGWKAL